MRTGFQRTHAPIVPRDRELSLVVELVQHPDGSLLTLVGPPGAGKTTLALMAAQALSVPFAMASHSSI
jgi:ATP-dependent protease Clp ATPase subunit